MEGWIKLHRKFIEWEWFNTPNMVHLFIYLLLKANHEDATWKGIEIKRGQFLTGRKQLSQNTKISEQTIRTCLKRLEKTEEINQQTNNQYSIITICKYDDYQSEKISTNKQTNQRLTSDQPTTNHKQEEEEYKKEKNIFIKPTLDEIKGYCLERNNSVNAEKFFNHYESNGWMVGKNKMKKWKNAIVTWEHNNDFETSKNGNQFKKEDNLPIRDKW